MTKNKRFGNVRRCDATIHLNNKSQNKQQSTKCIQSDMSTTKIMSKYANKQG